MTKKRKPMDDLPTMVSVEDVAVVETSTPMIDPELMAESMVVSVPFLSWETGYTRRRVDGKLDSGQARTLKGILHGLERQEAQLRSGKFVTTPFDAIRWMLENVR